MSTDNSPSPSPSAAPTAVRTTAENPKRRSKRSKPHPSSPSPSPSSASATLIYVPVPVLVQNLPPVSSYGASASRKARKAAQPVLNEQQMEEWKCQADDCPVRAGDVGKYYQRHRICPEHSKAPSVMFNGTEQRYCQQCSRFHELTEFDGSRRSCRRQLCRRRLIRTLNTFSSEEVEQM